MFFLRTEVGNEFIGDVNAKKVWNYYNVTQTGLQNLHRVHRLQKSHGHTHGPQGRVRHDLEAIRLHHAKAQGHRV